MFGNLGWRADVEVDTRVELVHPVEAVLPRHAPVCLQTQHGSSDDETRNEALFVFDSGTLQIRRDSDSKTHRRRLRDRDSQRETDTETQREKLRDRDSQRETQRQRHREKLRRRDSQREAQR